MHPRKWLSNSTKTYSEIDMKDRAKQTDFKYGWSTFSENIGNKMVSFTRSVFL